MAEQGASGEPSTLMEGYEDEGFEEAELALSGINMMLNNNFDEASALFQKYKQVLILYFMLLYQDDIHQSKCKPKAEVFVCGLTYLFIRHTPSYEYYSCQRPHFPWHA